MFILDIHSQSFFIYLKQKPQTQYLDLWVKHSDDQLLF